MDETTFAGLVYDATMRIHALALDAIGAPGEPTWSNDELWEACSHVAERVVGALDLAYKAPCPN